MDHAVAEPDDRKLAVDGAVGTLNWRVDPNLAAFGIVINEKMMRSTPRRLEFPTIHYAGRTFAPDKARNLVQKIFIFPKASTNAAFVNLSGCSDEDVGLIWNSIKRAYNNHVVIQRNNNTIGLVTFYTGLPDLNALRNVNIVFFLIKEKNTVEYQRYKKALDCRLQVPSQFITYHGKGKAQKCMRTNASPYWSNLSLKINAKLGGTAFVSSPTNQLRGGELNGPTMMIGLDVSHAAPGSDLPSLAAMSVSLDKHGAYYGGMYHANGQREEIVGFSVMEALLQDLLKHWVVMHKAVPAQLYFFRDGVSEGQFQHVLETEVKAIEAVFKNCGYKKPKITVIVATKRHHVRAFMHPEMMNPERGTLVEDVATHPQQWDFYLFSHVALKGTARPVHYHVIQDEIGCSRQELPKLIYRQCYQYCRCPTPVSLHPAIYYAHLISKRAHLADNLEGDEQMLRALPIGNLKKQMWFV
ncbi:hypothetical protein PG994_000702 [Apiospora phragmitis]|uniref:Piwi domain-containing protein n=1 Tax=Apiospora phragmitis TaxID=2905665 RepID=A0ABR1X730_9PEZI